MEATTELGLGTLDYVYAPSSDVAADTRWLSEVLDAEVVFAIDSDGARVAMLRIGSGTPPVLVASHLHDQRPIFLYRVASLEAVSARLAAGGWTSHAVELPPGPALILQAPGGLHLGVYEPTRLEVVESWTGTRNF